MNNTIPLITNPLGRHWGQPNIASILVDDTHAVMNAATFKQLAEYSVSTPSGVYPGKMWKRNHGMFDPDCKPQDRQWWLCWFGEVPNNPTVCSNNHRIILEVA